MNKNNMTIQEAMKELKEPQYLGEEGDMAVNCKTKIGAYRKFRQLVREDRGECSELEEMSIENVGIGFVFIATEKEKEELSMEESEYYVSYTKKSPYQVWVYTP
jgi:phosphoribosylaminoimidazole (AIR) synthetase